MANADFSQNQNPDPGGFDAGSYREAAPKTETARLTPVQQKLAGLEKSLPAALRTQGAALAGPSARAASALAEALYDEDDPCRELNNT